MRNTVRVDSKGRITLGRYAEGVDSFEVKEGKGHLLLFPKVEVPADEAWVFNNREFLAKLDRSIKQAKSGKTVYLGSFAKYAKDATKRSK